MRGTAATRGWASNRSTSARVATLTCSRVLVRDTFVFTMVHSVTNACWSLFLLQRLFQV
jgi:hypothetical protein